MMKKLFCFMSGPFCGRYTACDVVPQLIEFNQKKYQSLEVEFHVVDLIADQLPKGDIVFIRQVLQHLSNQQIVQLIPKLVRNYRFLVLTEHLPKAVDFSANIDHPAGPDIRLGIGSGVVLTKPPFSLEVLSEQILCEAEEAGGLIRTMLYRLQ